MPIFTFFVLRQVLQDFLNILLGNNDGIGWIRKRELLRSLRQFGMTNVKKISIIDDPDHLSDGFTHTWDVERAAIIIEGHVSKWNIEILLSFDDMGVSGHPNHISAFQASRLVASRRNNTTALYSLSSLTFFPLPSLIVLCKYCSIVCAFLCSLTVDDVILLSPYEYATILLPAMRCHRSQLVWFRRLYIIFSCYMFCNIYNRIKISE